MPQMYELLEHLKEEHRKVRGMFEQLEKKRAGATKGKAELFMKLRKDLIPHMEGEENALYERLLQKRQLRQHTLEGWEEHRVAERILHELESMDMGEERWSPMLKVLKENVEHHIEEEEAVLFKEIQGSLGKPEMEEINMMYEREEERARSSIS